MRSYGVLNEKTMTANRSLFLIDPQGILRKKLISIVFAAGSIETFIAVTPGNT